MAVGPPLYHLCTTFRLLRNIVSSLFRPHADKQLPSARVNFLRSSDAHLLSVSFQISHHSCMMASCSTCSPSCEWKTPSVIRDTCPSPRLVSETNIFPGSKSTTNRSTVASSNLLVFKPNYSCIRRPRNGISTFCCLLRPATIHKRSEDPW